MSGGWAVKKERNRERMRKKKELKEEWVENCNQRG